MEAFRESVIGGQECPILCITKSILFVIISVFVLYLPLGDPHEHCATSAARNNNSGTLCCLCDVHKFMLKVARRTTDATETLVSVILETLYEFKLKFYALLEKLDGNDLCRSVCCSDEPEEQCDVKERRPRAPCRCRNKCKRRS